MNEQNLSRIYIDSIPDAERQFWLAQISDFLTERILRASNFEHEILNIISDLRILGHDLWLYDTDGEWETWCGDYSKAENCGKLILHFEPSTAVEVTWSEPK